MTLDDVTKVAPALHAAVVAVLDEAGLRREEVALYVDFVMDDGKLLRTNIGPPA